jgi:hypothetical protein
MEQSNRVPALSRERRSHPIMQALVSVLHQVYCWHRGVLISAPMNDILVLMKTRWQSTSLNATSKALFSRVDARRAMRVH